MAITRDVILDTISEMTRAATGKVEELTEKSKLALGIAEKERELAELFRELGKVVYESRKGGSDVITTETLLAIIDEKVSVLEALRERKYAKMKPVCSGCGVNLSDEFAFCPKCGVKNAKPASHDIVDIVESVGVVVEETVAGE